MTIKLICINDQLVEFFSPSRKISITDFELVLQIIFMVKDCNIDNLMF